MDLILRLVLGQFLVEIEWQDITKRPEARELFFGVPGGCAPESVYHRSWLPTILRMVLTSIPMLLALALLLGGLYLLVVSLVDPVVTGGADLELIMLGIGGVILYVTVVRLVTIYRGRPGSTPRIVAVYPLGIAWIKTDGTGFAFLPFEQVSSTTLQEDALLIQARDGQWLRFHPALDDLPFGKSARVAAGELPPSTTLVACPYCGEKISRDSTRCLFCMQVVGGREMR